MAIAPTEKPRAASWKEARHGAGGCMRRIADLDGLSRTLSRTAAEMLRSSARLAEGGDLHNARSAARRAAEVLAAVEHARDREAHELA